VIITVVFSIFSYTYSAGKSATFFFKDMVSKEDFVKVWQALKEQNSLQTRLPTRATYPASRSYNVGDVENFWSYNFQTLSYELLPARCAYVGTHCYVFIAERDAYLVTTTEAELLGSKFDNDIYPTDTAWFGNEPNPGIDGDPRIFILLLDIKDWYEQTGEYYIGYFSFYNELPEAVASAPPYNGHSNEKEMFYMDVYPTVVGGEEQLATLAHEFQHMIHWNHDPDEEDWLNESLSDWAEVVNGFGYHFSHVDSYLDNPNTSVTIWKERLADYGAAFCLLSYAIDRYGGDTDLEKQNFVRLLVADQKNGIESLLHSIELKTGFRPEWQDLLGDMYVALYFDSIMKYDPYRFKSFTLHKQPKVSYIHSHYPTNPYTYATEKDGAIFILLEPAESGNKNIMFEAKEGGLWYVELAGLTPQGEIQVVRKHTDSGTIYLSASQLGSNWLYAVMIVYYAGPYESSRFSYSIGNTGPIVSVMPHPVLTDYWIFSTASATPPALTATYSGDGLVISPQQHYTCKIGQTTTGLINSLNLYMGTEKLEKVGWWELQADGSNLSGPGIVTYKFYRTNYIVPDI